jgi:aspartate/tyrosine/aromatic aminotransferase
VTAVVEITSWFFGAGRHISLFAGTTPVPADPILGLVAAFLEDPSPNKVNLAQGAYRTEQGEPLLLDAVRRAEERVVARGGSKEYLGARRTHRASRRAPPRTSQVI